MRVVIADDEMLLREGLARLLTEPGFEVVGKAGDPDKLLATSATPARRRDRRHQDATDPHRRGAGGRRARSAAAIPTSGVLVLSQYLESRYAIRLLQHHPEPVGYLLKERVSDIAVLADAIRRIAEGESVIDPTIVARLVDRPRHSGPLDELTEREREVLGLIAEGRSNHGIATAGAQPQDRGGARRPDLLQARAPRRTRLPPPRPRRAHLPARPLKARGQSPRCLL